MLETKTKRVIETYEQKRAKAERVMERYFDIDITDAGSAMDVFLDNGVDPQIAAEIAQDMFPITECEEPITEREEQEREWEQEARERPQEDDSNA